LSAEFSESRSSVVSVESAATARLGVALRLLGQPDHNGGLGRVGESLAPRLSKLPGFSGYFLIDTGEGVMSSIGLFDSSTQADESTRVASEWVRDEKLEKILQNPQKVTGGEVIAHKTNGAARA
jgi:hypothetical protein